MKNRFYLNPKPYGLWDRLCSDFNYNANSVACKHFSARAYVSSLFIPMTLASLKFARKPTLHLRSTPFQCVPKVVPRSLAVAKAEAPTNELSSVSIREEGKGRLISVENEKAPTWKRLNYAEIGVHNSMIGSTTKKVLNGLKKKGKYTSVTFLSWDVYLVGGCVWDLILKQTPKDFDVTRTFSLCEIVGKRFPVCHVHIDDTIVEVSSFDTTKCKAGMEFSHHIEAPNGCDKKDQLRWMNCLNRDFTINGLMLDPYARIVYDYFGGIEDIRKAKMCMYLISSVVRTVIPTETSFQEDCAGILRAIRIAARLGFSISKETTHFINNLSSSVLSLDKALDGNELYASIWFRGSFFEAIMEIRSSRYTSPLSGCLFAQHGFQRQDRRTNMLLSLFSKLDKLLAPNRPCQNSLW
ncbi:Poly(A) polymerase I [Glycine max]|nr:Poly(A) polymerase I [Glycine max]KAH1246012.1 Poly(A) polymerase I [Glycine max]